MPLIEEHPFFILVQLPMRNLYPRIANAAAEALDDERAIMSVRLPEETVAYNELLALMHYSAMGIATVAFQEFAQRQMGRFHYSGITQVALLASVKPITELVTLGLEIPSVEFSDMLEKITAIQHRNRASPHIYDIPENAFVPLDCFYSVPDFSTALQADTWKAIRADPAHFAIVTLSVKIRYSSLQIPAQQRIKLNELASIGRYCLASFLPGIPCPLELLKSALSSLREDGHIRDMSWWLPTLQLLSEQEWLTVLPDQSTSFIVSEKAHQQLFQMMHPERQETLMPFMYGRMAVRNASNRCLSIWMQENKRAQLRQALPHLTHIAQSFIDAVAATNTPPSWEDIFFIIQIGDAALRCQKVRDAQRLLRISLEFIEMAHHPGNPMLKAQCYEVLGDIAWKKKHSAEARSYWEMAMNQIPNSAKSQEVLRVKMAQGVSEQTSQQAI
jgi:hypothetical protein